jgi:hypothetical protein
MTIRIGSLLFVLAFGVIGVVGLTWSTPQPVAAEEKKEAGKPDAAAVERARAEVKKLDDLYKTAVVGITQTYVEKQSDVPAAAVAKALFDAMHKKGYHTARLVDASGKPKSRKNVAETDFEKKVVADIKGGKTYTEEIGERDGKPVFRAGTIVPAVMKQCSVCHSVKEGELLGVLVYEVPIK